MDLDDGKRTDRVSGERRSSDAFTRLGSRKDKREESLNRAMARMTNRVNGPQGLDARQCGNRIGMG